MNRLVLDQLQVARGERVLEVGFGGAELLEALLKCEAQEVVGIDISDAMVARARRRFADALTTGRLRLLTASAEALPRQVSGFDKACSVNTVYFWSRPSAVLAELARVTRPGGSLSLAFQLPEAVRAWPGHRCGFHIYGADELAGLLEAAGFHPPARASGHDKEVGEFLCLTSERK
jgi:ubiquinone/menaquinone biosynthesis C-methylase UbiE